MNQQDDMEKRRARLQVLRERYETQPAVSPLPATPVPMSEESRKPGAGGERSGTGLLPRLVEALLKAVPGDTPVPGTPVGEQRLRQVLRQLEQRAQNASGAASERIQRLIRFLTQDVPGEPMVAGVNVRRLQQLLERAPAAASAPSVPSVPVAVEAPAAMSAPPAVSPLPVAAAPLPSTAMVVAQDEIAKLEENLRQLRQMTEVLQARLDAVRRWMEQAASASGAVPPPAAPIPSVSAPAAAPAAASAPVHAVEDGWFLEFLE